MATTINTARLLRWESTGLPSGRSWIQTPAGPTTRVFKKTGEIMLTVI